MANGKVGINEDDEIVHNVSLSFTFILRQQGKLTKLCEKHLYLCINLVTEFGDKKGERERDRKKVFVAIASVERIMSFGSVLWLFKKIYVFSDQ